MTNYNTMLTDIAGEMQEYARKNQGSIFPVDPINNQYAMFKSRKYPGVYALVFGWNRDGASSKVEISLLVGANYLPLRPELVQQIEALAPSQEAVLRAEYQGLVVQLEQAARNYDFFGMFMISQKIVALQSRALAAGIDPLLFPIPAYGAAK